MPKLNSFRDLPFTAKVFNYTKKSDPTGAPILTYGYFKDIKCGVTQGIFGRATLTFGDDAHDIMDSAQLRDVRDKDGNEVYPNGVWTLQGIVPLLTPFGTREGFRGDAKLTHLDG